MTENLRERVLHLAAEVRDTKYIRGVTKKYDLDHFEEQEIIDDTILEILDSLKNKKFEERGNGLQGYLVTAYKRNCIDAKKAKSMLKRRHHRDNLELGEEVACHKTPEPLDILIFDEARDIVRKSVDELNGRTKDIVFSVLYTPGYEVTTPAERAALSRGMRKVKDNLKILGYL